MQTLRYSLCRQCFRRVIVDGLVKPRVGVRTTRLFATGKPRRAENDERVKVRWFEQSGDESTRRPIDDLEAVENDETKSLKAELDKEDAELREMRKELSAEELQELENAMAEAKLGEDFSKVFDAEEDEDDVDLEDDEILNLANEAGLSDEHGQPSAAQHARTSIKSQYSPLDIQLYLSDDQRPYLEQLNKSLRRASIESTSASSLGLLWRWYARCKQTLPPFLSLIPDPSWELLEKSTKYPDLAPKEVTIRSRILLEDAKNAGRPFDRSTRLTYVRLLLEEGRLMDAVRQWKQDEVALRADRGLALHFEETGVQIFAEAEDFPKAQELALGRIQQTTGPKSRSLIPLVAARARNGDEDGLKRAWALYDQFKIYMGSDMTLTDYDRIAKIFLHAGRTDISLAVFKDYILTTQPWRNAPSQRRDPSFSTLKEMFSRTENIEMYSRLSLTSLALLPHEYNHKYFYAGWMKRLIAAGDNEGALAVVQLMYYRKVKPDAKHLNGVIGAWLRGGSIKDKEKAIQLAWTMVLQRLALVARRNGQTAPTTRQIINGSGQTGLVPPSWATYASGHTTMSQTHEGGQTGLTPPDDSRKVVPPGVNRPLPPASIETFCLLLLYYSRRNMLGYVEKVQELLNEAEIPPNSYFMNHLLYSQLRRGDYDGVWKGYRKMSSWVRRDLETFACLWDTQKGHLGKVAFRERRQDYFPSPRLLFCEMTEFLGSQTDYEHKVTRERMSQDLYDQIVRCFCLANDIEGTFVCLHALKNSFGLFPDQNIARMISIQVSRLGEGTPQRPGRRRKRVPKPMVNLNRAAQVLGFLAEERGEYLSARGIELEDTDQAFKNEESLYILTSMLRVVLERQLRKGADIQERLESVAWEMGVSGIYMGDHLEKPEIPDQFDIELAEVQAKAQAT